jgi:PAS domain S-box-containing protein
LLIDAQRLAYVDVNEAACRLAGRSREEMLRLGPVAMSSAVGQYTQDELEALYQAVIAMYPESNTAISRLTYPDGSARVLESTRRAVKIDGEWLIVMAGRDVTARERAARELHQRVEELARSNRDLEQFAYVTSHDLSEPLRMVASYTQLLARRYGTHFDDDGREFMGYVVTGAQRMKQLIDDLLLYSRAGRSAAELKEVSLDKALDAALANLAHAIRDSNASIERPADLPTLACDKSGMTQVFQNLVANAIKFKGQAPPAVRIEAARDGQDWIISVTDNGIGIEPQYFDRIFVIFQRLHARTEYEGTGIGLAICKRIVERHEGKIWVESTVGQGTSFKLRLTATS